MVKYLKIKSLTIEFVVRCFKQTVVKRVGESVMTALMGHNIHKQKVSDMTPSPSTNINQLESNNPTNAEVIIP